MTAFSVVIPVHNKEPHVARALQSVADQTLPAMEVLVIDDASPDRSVDVIKPFLSDTVRLLHRDIPGPGGYEARNLGTREAVGEWVAFLDADDAWEPDHLATLMAALGSASDKVGCVATCHTIHHAAGDERIPVYVRDLAGLGTQRLDGDSFLKLWVELNHCPIRTSCVAFKRSLLLDVGGFPEGRCQRGGDKDLWLRACAATETIVIPEVTSVYYANSVNMVTRQTGRNRTPCMCHSVDRLLADARGDRRRLLKRIHNLEVLRYATNTWSKEPLKRAHFRTYYASQDPVGYVRLQIMKLVPGQNLKTIRSWRRRLRSAMTRTQH